MIGLPAPRGSTPDPTRQTDDAKCRETRAANDALADWQDVVPESVEELGQELTRETTQESGGRANG